MKKIILFLINFYQKYLTILSFGSCRYHPTCSSYAKVQFENNNILKALYFSIIRILKCNPLFSGGFDYVKTKCPNENKINLKFKKIKVKYWKIPVENNYCLIIKHNTKWDK